MKNFIKKINRGILLSFILLLSVVIYLAALSAGQAREKPLLEEICRQYVETEIAYSVLPEQYRAESVAVPSEELASYIDEMENAISSFYIDSEMILQLAVDRLAGNLRNQAEGWSRVKVYEKSIQYFDSYEFEGNQVTVRFNTVTTIERTNSELSSQPETRQVGETEDVIILQKAEGQWYVVYALLNEPSSYRY